MGRRGLGVKGSETIFAHGVLRRDAAVIVTDDPQRTNAAHFHAAVYGAVSAERELAAEQRALRLFERDVTGAPIASRLFSSLASRCIVGELAPTEITDDGAKNHDEHAPEVHQSVWREVSTTLEYT